MAYIGTSPSNGVRRRFVYEATANQTSFSGNDESGITLTYVDSLYLDVFQNGIKLKAGDDYTATTGTTVVLVQGASADDVLEMVAFDVFSVNDSVSASAGGSFAGNIGMGGTLAVTGNTTVGGTLGVTGVATVANINSSGTIVASSTASQGFRAERNGTTGGANIDSVLSSGSLHFRTGTTERMKIDSTGAVTMPYQPAFLVKSANDDQTNLTLNANTAVAFGTEIFDNNSDFASNVFTAPVTGRYHLNFHIRIDNIDSVTQYTIILLVTSNRNLQFIHGNSGYDSDVNHMSIQGSHLVDMDAGDTAGVHVSLPSLGTAQADISSESHFSGYLVA